MTAPPPDSPLLHEYRKGTEPAPGDDARGWQRMHRRLFPSAGPARSPAHSWRGRFLVGGLATALAAAWLLGGAPGAGRPGITGASGAGGSEGTSGRGWSRGGSPGSGNI